MTASDPRAPGFAVRVATMDDLPAVTEVVRASDVAEFGEPEYGGDELREEWAGLDLANDVFVAAEPTGQIVGYATVGHRGPHVKIDAEAYVHPEHEGRGIGTALVRETERRGREHVPLAPPDAQIILNNWINSWNGAARLLLEGEGYEAVRHFWRMQIDLAGPPPEPVWPAGIAVRSVAGPEDERRAFAAVDEAFRDHWGYLTSTFEDWERRKKKEDFDPGLWLIALDGDEVAGAAIGSYSMGMGWVNDVAVRRPWRRRGLGLALLLELFAAFRERGRTRVALGVDAESPTGATRLYERAGMRAVREFAAYQKELRAGKEWEDEG